MRARDMTAAPFIANNRHTGYRQFTTTNGSLNFEAKVVDWQDGIVTLERLDGSLFKVKESALSDNDRVFVQRWLAKR